MPVLQTAVGGHRSGVEERPQVPVGIVLQFLRASQSPRVLEHSIEEQHINRRNRKSDIKFGAAETDNDR